MTGYNVFGAIGKVLTCTMTDLAGFCDCGAVQGGNVN